MPRSHRPRRAVGKAQQQRHELEALDRVLEGISTVEKAGDGEWMVRTVSAVAARKEYSCPGCGRAVLQGNPHLVVWREDWIFGEADAIEGRRHWHTACWRGRSFRNRSSGAGR